MLLARELSPLPPPPSFPFPSACQRLLAPRRCVLSRDAAMRIVPTRPCVLANKEIWRSRKGWRTRCGYCGISAVWRPRPFVHTRVRKRMQPNMFACWRRGDPPAETKITGICIRSDAKCHCLVDYSPGVQRGGASRKRKGAAPSPQRFPYRPTASPGLNALALPCICLLLKERCRLFPRSS